MAIIGTDAGHMSPLRGGGPRGFVSSPLAACLVGPGEGFPAPCCRSNAAAPAGAPKGRRSTARRITDLSLSLSCLPTAEVGMTSRSASPLEMRSFDRKPDQSCLRAEMARLRRVAISLSCTARVLARLFFPAVEGSSTNCNCSMGFNRRCRR